MSSDGRARIEIIYIGSLMTIDMGSLTKVWMDKVTAHVRIIMDRQASSSC